MLSEKRKLWEWCRTSRQVCDRVGGNCDKCNSLEKKRGLERKKKEESKKGGEKC